MYACEGQDQYRQHCIYSKVPDCGTVPTVVMEAGNQSFLPLAKFGEDDGAAGIGSVATLQDQYFYYFLGLSPIIIPFSIKMSAICYLDLPLFEVKYTMCDPYIVLSLLVL